MSQCLTCGRGTIGFLRCNCEQEPRATAASIVDLTTQAAHDAKAAIPTVARQIRTIAETQGLEPLERDRAVIEAWQEAIDSLHPEGEAAATAALRERLLLLNLHSDEPISEEEYLAEEGFRLHWTSWLVRAVHELLDGTPDSLRQFGKALKGIGFSPETRERILLEAWAIGAAELLDDHILDEDELDRLLRFAAALQLDHEALQQYPIYQHVFDCNRIRAVHEGKWDGADHSMVSSQVQLEPAERLQASFPETSFREVRNDHRGHLTQRIVDRIDATDISYVSPIVAGNFDFGLREPLGDPTDGTLHLTTRHLIFDTPDHGFKIALSEITDVEMLEAGVALDIQTSPNSIGVFLTGDGWVAANLLNAALANARRSRNAP